MAISQRPEGHHHRRRRIALAVAAACAVAILAIVGSGPAEAVTRTEKTFQSWLVTCIENEGKPRTCSMAQRRVDPQSRQTVFIWSLTRGEDQGIVQSLTVPAGVSIKEGARLFVGEGGPLTFGYDVCGPRICHASLPFGEEVLDRIRGADKASASYVRASRQLVQVSLDLAGFDEAFAYFREQLGA